MKFPSFRYEVVWDSSLQHVVEVANEVELIILLPFERREEMRVRDFALL